VSPAKTRTLIIAGLPILWTIYLIIHQPNAYMTKLLILLSFIFISRLAKGFPPLPGPVMVVEHYNFSLRINDDNDTLDGTASITVKISGQPSGIYFDLVGLQASGKGMIVGEVTEAGKAIPFTQERYRLNLDIRSASAQASGQASGQQAARELTFVITYKGIPADGLIYSKNKYDHRTIFGDNWPDRARNWLPCVDHPSDKAAVDFEITAPDHYQVVANGIKVKESDLPDHFRYTHWKEEIPLPPKVMTIGVADFAVDLSGYADGIPVYSWVYPEDKEKGFYDYAQATAILPFYISKIGPYSYKKLANVQSKTIFGGMENADCIFYAENSITGTRRSERLLAHEIAHQWFGDAVTETDYSHLWLSEGFATYMSALYLESKYGPDTLLSMLRTDRAEVIDFSKVYVSPVVDTTKDYMKLLNAYSYQKGGWILHMLRSQLGDSIFWKGIRRYYARFRGANASTQDLESVMESASGLDLKDFFRQWLFTAGQPNLHLTWKYDEMTKLLHLTITQRQDTAFIFPLDIGIAGRAESFLIKNKTTELDIHADTAPDRILLDPYTRLLFEQTP
jgi:aminopeptidase N